MMLQVIIPSNQLCSFVFCSPWTARRLRSWRKGAQQPEGPRNLGCLELLVGCNPETAWASARSGPCSRCPSGQCPAPPCSHRRWGKDNLAFALTLAKLQIHVNNKQEYIVCCLQTTNNVFQVLWIASGSQITPSFLSIFSVHYVHL